jgi:hypothetical protein
VSFTFGKIYIPPGGKKKKISQIFRNVNLTFLNKNYKTHMEAKKSFGVVISRVYSKIKTVFNRRVLRFFAKNIKLCNVNIRIFSAIPLI